MPEIQVNEDEVLQRAAQGDREAFGRLYRRRRPDVYRFVLHMTADAAVAEDVVQDVFLTVMRDGGRFEPGRAAVVAWLCGIARNHLRQRLSRDRRLEPLGRDEPLAWRQDAEGLVIDLPEQLQIETNRPCKQAYAFKIPVP